MVAWTLAALLRVCSTSRPSISCRGGQYLGHGIRRHGHHEQGAPGTSLFLRMCSTDSTPTQNETWRECPPGFHPGMFASLLSVASHVASRRLRWWVVGKVGNFSAKKCRRPRRSTALVKRTSLVSSGDVGNCGELNINPPTPCQRALDGGASLAIARRCACWGWGARQKTIILRTIQADLVILGLYRDNSNMAVTMVVSARKILKP